MKKYALLLISFLGLSFLMSAEEKPYVLKIGDFNTLQVIDAINVTYRCNTDSAGLAVFVADGIAAKTLIFSNNGNKLKIEKDIDDGLPPVTLPHITVYSNFLAQAENCGDSTLTVFSPAPGASFKARVIGNGTLIVKGIHATQTEGTLDTGKGNIVLEGITKAVKLKNIGTGQINAKELSAESATATLLGTGSISCKASDELTVKGMGTGKVFVYGSPKIKKRALGPIKIVEEK